MTSPTVINFINAMLKSMFYVLPKNVYYGQPNAYDRLIRIRRDPAFLAKSPGNCVGIPGHLVLVEN